jgi:large-conductance mechanosensitive channel
MLKLLDSDNNKSALLITIISAASVDLLSSLNNDIIIPFIDKIFDNKDDNNDLTGLQTYKIQLYGSTLNLGLFILNVMRFLFIYLIVMIMFKILL